MILIHFVIVLGILIFVHEFGHFIVAKLAGVKIEKFSLGFGPKLIGKTIGETEYLISAFPLGGYVKMFGEGGIVEEVNNKNAESNTTEETYDEESGELIDGPHELSEEDKLRSFAHKPALVRIAIVLAGPVFNLLFAWLVVIILFMTSYPIMTSRVKPLSDKPAAKAGLVINDVIVAINGNEIVEWEDIAPLLASSKGSINLTINRAGEMKSITVIPEQGFTHNLFGEKVNQPVIGIAPTGEFKNISFSPTKAISVGTIKAIKLVDLTIRSLMKLAQGIIPLKTIGGPLQIADLAHQAANMGGSNFFLLLALISINLGVLNLLPIPILDGGHLLFYSIELVTRRPVPQRIREYAQQIGIVLLLGLMIIAFYNDIIRYFVNHQG